MVPEFARWLDEMQYHNVNRTITTLNLNNNLIGDAGATALASALQVTPLMRGPPVHTTCSRGPDAHIPSCMWHGFAVAQQTNLLCLVVKDTHVHVSL